ncbi:MAG: hypothetical protein IKZ65_07945, partial [Lachnospiraceae bacterium]|nr:hypothetical protein [Lachnospiraceae bacterium]
MKTKHVPVLCVLIAGVTVFIMDIVQGMDFSTIFRDFLCAVVIFFIIGMVAKAFLDKAFNPKEPDPEEEAMEDFPTDENGEDAAGDEEDLQGSVE